MERKGYFGGTDAAAVMGLSPWTTPVELWQQKTGRKPREEVTEAKQKIYDRGHKLEPFIRDMVVDKLRDMGLVVDLVASNERYADAEFPFLACEIDFELIVTGDVEIGGKVYTMTDERINGDAKSVTGFARKKWGETDTEDVPIEYATQFLHGLGVTRRNFCLVAALRSFDDVDIFWTVRDDEIIEAMREKMLRFWTEHVLADVPPDPIDFSDIKELFPLDNGQATEATAEIAEKVRSLQDIKKRIKDLEDAADVLQFSIGEFISPNAILKYEGREIATWKAQQDRRIDTKLFSEENPDMAARYMRTKTIRVLRLSKKK